MHSPFPWKIVTRSGTGTLPTTAILDAEDQDVANDEPYYPEHVTPENQAEIVRRCNAFPYLLTALRTADNYLDDEGKGDSKAGLLIRQLLDQYDR